MIHSILFDFDGVLVESVDIKTQAFAELFAGESSEAVREIIAHHERNGGVSRTDKFEYMYKSILRCKYTEEIASELGKRFSELVFEKVLNAPHTKGALSFLERYSGAFKCFVISGTPEEELVRIVEKRKLKSYFSGVFGSPKSKPQILQLLIDDGAIEKETSVFIGDSLTDFDAAQKFDIRFIARIHETNTDFFRSIECLRCNDLTNLSETLTQVD